MKSLFFIIFMFSFLVAVSQEQASFYFNTGKSVLEKTEQDKLEKWMLANKDSKVLGINGFCDEEGSVSLNDTLAKKRVDFISGRIKGKIKFREDFKTRAFGKLHTMSKEKAENRRVTLYYILPKDFGREEEILAKEKPKEEKVHALVVEKPENKPEPKIKFPENLVLEKEDGTEENVKLDTVFMKKLYRAKNRERYTLENINFYLDTYEVIPTSISNLYELLLVMQANPNLQIQIQGHLCCVYTDHTSSSYGNDLSANRARVVYEFLLENDIDKSRISYIGFGSSKPIYRIPETTLDQQKANRRVEIFIVKNKY